MTTQVPVSMIDVGPFGLRNRIINGDMRIAQRSGGSVGLTNGYAYQTVDRFFFIMAGTAAGGTNQTASAPAGFRNAVTMYRNSGSALTGNIQMGQIVESANIYDLRGKTVTLSFFAACGTTFSAAGSLLTSQIITGTAADATSATLGSWTGQAAAANQAIPITTSFARYSLTATVPSNAQSLAVLFSWTPVGTAGVDDSVRITGVQLEVGDVATPFEYRPFGVELALCQRYFYKTFDQSVAPAQNAGGVGAIGFIGQVTGVLWDQTLNLPVTMRATPTVTTFSPNGASANWSTNTDTPVASVIGASASSLIVRATTPTAGRSYTIQLTASAEL